MAWDDGDACTLHGFTVVDAATPAEGGNVPEGETLIRFLLAEERYAACLADKHSEFVQWSDTKAKIREIDPEWDSPERVADREAGREQLRAELRGAQLAEMRKRVDAVTR
ncbi:hypothetical protein HNP84_002886 [Thermocatellispora tengchongensis]|uniref:Uncharacterized protein n=1 Tax=Thermocatellispora tengchongensis TaxID=1073253 RepID=A0A840PB01_9ACTN|nr:hypothetical protein [Thermocatellispora tengchongensis]MBB5133165.1 hypothetical protein [Thermocatellispora tengchongensis]